MKRSLFRSIAFSGIACLLISLSALAQDFQQNYRIGSGGTVNIRNVSGNVHVTGYNGDTITVVGYKKGRDRDRVSIEDSSSGNSVNVRVHYPDECNCDASVNFEVKVPSGIRYRYDSISSVSGDVAAENTQGDLRIKSVSGNVSVRGANGSINASSVSGNVEVGEVSGTVNAKSTSGNVEVEIRSLEGAESMEYASVSGNVQVKLPSNLDAEVKMSTMSGSLRTDFPLTIEEAQHGPGRKATGRIGGGSRSLRMSSVSGSVRLLQM